MVRRSITVALSAMIASTFVGTQVANASWPIHPAAAMSAAKGKSKKKNKKKNKKKESEAEDGSSESLPPPPPPPLPPSIAEPVAAEGPKNIVCDCHVETERQFGRAGAMKSAGWGVFGTSLGVSAVYGLLINGAYLIPIVGPYIGIANDETLGGLFLGVTLGTAQLVSLPIAIVGTVRRHRLAGRIAANKKRSAFIRTNLEFSGSGIKLHF